MCSGKTEVILELKRRGYFVVPEVALSLIEKEAKGKGKIFPWTGIKKFMQRVYELQIKLEGKIPKSLVVVFLDRALIDCIAYYKIHKISIPKELGEAVKKIRYHKIFLLEMLPEEYWNKTKSGKPRGQTYKEGQETHKVITKVYAQYKQKIIKIPYMSIKKRVDMIEKYIS